MQENETDTEEMYQNILLKDAEPKENESGDILQIEGETIEMSEITDGILYDILKPCDFETDTIKPDTTIKKQNNLENNQYVNVRLFFVCCCLIQKLFVSLLGKQGRKTPYYSILKIMFKMKKIEKLSITSIEKANLLTEKELFEMCKTALKNGEVQAEKLFFYLRMFSKCTELLNKDPETKNIIQEALERYDNQNLYGYGVQVTHRKDFDYIGTGSLHYLKLKEKQKEINKQVKEYEDFLEKVDCEMTTEKEEGNFLKPITFTRTKIVSIVKPYKEVKAA